MGTTKQNSNSRNQIGYFTCTSYVVGNIIGSGLFITPGIVLTYTNSIGISLLIWLMCGLTSIMGGIIYSELGTAISQPGCDFAYIVFVGWEALAFSFMWVCAMMTFPAAAAVQVKAFGQYIVTGLAPVLKLEKPWDSVTELGLGILLLVCFTVINFYSISRVAGRFQIIATFAKVTIVTVIILTGFYYFIFKDWTENIKQPFSGSIFSPGNLGLAFYSGLWSYDGWDILNYGTPEIYKPRRTMPLSLISGIVIVTSIYLLTNFSYFVVLTQDQISSSPAIAVDFAQSTLGSFSYSVPFLVAILLIGTLNSILFVGSRFMHAAARSGHLPKFLSAVNKESGSPRAALLGQVICITIVCFVDINTLINYVTFVIWGQRTVTLSALLYIRWKKIPVAEGAIRVPLPLIIIFWCISLFLVVVPFIAAPMMTLIGVIFVFSGLIFYFLLVKSNRTPNTLKTINEFLAEITCKILICELDLKEESKVSYSSEEKSCTSNM